MNRMRPVYPPKDHDMNAARQGEMQDQESWDSCMNTNMAYVCRTTLSNLPGFSYRVGSAFGQRLMPQTSLLDRVFGPKKYRCLAARQIQSWPVHGLREMVDAVEVEVRRVQ